MLYEVETDPKEFGHTGTCGEPAKSASKPTKPTAPNGVVIYAGPSMLDGKPIVAIATGLVAKSRNGKTGEEVQVWILCADESPADAVNSGRDFSICANCKHRGRIELLEGVAKNVGRSCYVTVWQAPLSVYKSYHRGIYPVAAPDVFAGRIVRIGAYGDPTAVPLEVWDAFLGHAEAVTGYTHQWQDPRFQGFKQWCMASVDSGSEYLAAKKLGWKTFRVRKEGEAIATLERLCPASKEAGYKTTCAKCKACGGESSKSQVDRVIIAHGSASKVAAFAAAA